MSVRFRLLNEADVRRVLALPELIPVMAEALSRFSAGEVLQPQRSMLSVGPEANVFGLMPAYAAALPALGAKLVTVFHRNPERGLTSHLASIVLLDPETGALRALVDGRYITEARTAAVSAVSALRMARPDARRLALLGSGVQARSHLEALAHALRLDDVRVWSPHREHREAFVDAQQPRVPVPLRASTSAEEAVRDADVVVLATTAREPVLQDAWVAPGAHVMSLGAYRPTDREMDPALVARARLVVDSRAAALVEAGDVVQGVREGRFGPEHVRAELGEVVLGRAAGRASPDEVTIFKSLGLAIEDLYAAELAYRRALEAGVGQELTL